MANSNLEDMVLPVNGQHTMSDQKARIWNEIKIIWRIAFPTTLSLATSFGMIIVTQSFLGHISEVELAAFAIVQSIFVRFIQGILLGLSSATETLCGQAFGAGHLHMMGIYLQRSWLVNGACATLLVPLLIFATPILRLIGQEEEIAAAAGPISLWFIPFLYNLVFSSTVIVYLQAQLKNLIVGFLSATSFVLHLLLSWIFVMKLNWGVHGAMAALAISSWSVVMGEFVYIAGGWCPDTWKGFSMAAFKDIWPVVKLSISSAIMICLEVWYNSILVLLAGYMKNATIAIDAFSICVNINFWELMVCLGLMAASIVRVGNELGKGNAEAVKFAIKTILGTGIVIGGFFWILCLVFGRQISYLFTDNEEVEESVSHLSVLLAFSILLNSVQPVLSGVAIAAGMQGMVAVVNLGCYYVIGVPAGALLGFVAHLQVTGLWIGLLGGVTIQTFVLGFIVWRTNWDEQVEKALERLNRFLLKPAEEGND